jgi:hypothetical protein
MHVEDVAADRHGREAAIADEFVPVGIASLGRVEAEGGEEVLGVSRREKTLVEHGAEAIGGELRAVAEERRFQAVEQRELLVGLQRRVVGDVVGGADELVEGEDRRAVARADEVRGDGKVLVAMGLARAGLSGGDHRARSAAAAW